MTGVKDKLLIIGMLFTTALCAQNAVHGPLGSGPTPNTQFAIAKIPSLSEKADDSGGFALDVTDYTYGSITKAELEKAAKEEARYKGVSGAALKKYRDLNSRLKFMLTQVSATELKMTFPVNQFLNFTSGDWALIAGSGTFHPQYVNFKFKEMLADGRAVFKGKMWMSDIELPDECTLILDAQGKISSVALSLQEMEAAFSVEAKSSATK